MFPPIWSASANSNGLLPFINSLSLECHLHCQITDDWLKKRQGKNETFVNSRSPNKSRNLATLRTNFVEDQIQVNIFHSFLHGFSQYLCCKPRLWSYLGKHIVGLGFSFSRFLAYSITVNIKLRLQWHYFAQYVKLLLFLKFENGKIGISSLYSRLFRIALKQKNQSVKTWMGDRNLRKGWQTKSSILVSNNRQTMAKYSSNKREYHH